MVIYRLNSTPRQENTDLSLCVEKNHIHILGDTG